MSETDWAARKDLLPIALMIDNSPGAYPQAGLDRADLVYAICHLLGLRPRTTATAKAVNA